MQQPASLWGFDMQIVTKIYGNKLADAICVTDFGYFVLTNRDMGMVGAALDDGLTDEEALGDFERFPTYEDALASTED